MVISELTLLIVADSAMGTKSENDCSLIGSNSTLLFTDVKLSNNNGDT